MPRPDRCQKQWYDGCGVRTCVLPFGHRSPHVYAALYDEATLTAMEYADDPT